MSIKRLYPVIQIHVNRRNQVTVMTAVNYPQIAQAFCLIDYPDIDL